MCKIHTCVHCRVMFQKLIYILHLPHTEYQENLFLLHTKQTFERVKQIENMFPSKFRGHLSYGVLHMFS